MQPEPAALAELWTAGAAAAADRHTMDALGMPSVVLMERAALCVTDEVEARVSGTGRGVFVLCGPGNNGGDGLAVARQLHGRGVSVRVALVTPAHNEVVEEQLRLARAYGVAVESGFESSPDGEWLLLDAILGTGSRGAPRGAVAAAIERVLAWAGPVVAVDLPSGVDPDTGAVPEAAVRAGLTVTFQRSKPGLHLTPGRDHAGAIVVGEIGLVGAPGVDCGRELIAPARVAAVLAALPAGRHKGERGHLGLVAGSGGTPGAAILAGAAALRAGAGLVTLASDDAALREQLVAARPELMVEPRSAVPLLPRSGALVVGPGLTEPSSRAGLDRLWRQDPRPAIWDASGLDEVGPGETPAGPRIVTPHPGEAARLLSRAMSDPWDGARVQADRVAAALALAGVVGAIVVLKGEGTVVADPAGRVAICTTGGPALATAGSGDALAGAIGALLARGVPVWDAACVGVHVHGTAGDLCERTRPGAVAMDVVDALGPARQACADPRALPSRWPRLRRG